MRTQTCVNGLSAAMRETGNQGRVLFVAAYDLSVANFFLPHFRLLQQMGLRVETAYRPSVSWASEMIARAGVKRYSVSFGRGPFARANLRALQQLSGILRQGEYDIVHVNMPVPGWLTRAASRLSSPRSTVIYTAHGFHFYHGGGLLANTAFVALERLAGRWTDYLVTINREDYEAARRLRIVDSNRVWYMPGVGIDTDYYDPARVSQQEVQSIRRGMGLTSDDVLLLMVADFRTGKRHRDAVAALSGVGDPHVHLGFAGTGPLLDETRTLCEASGLIERVHFLGHREDIPALIRASRATVLPSEREGLPRSVLESLALEVPAIGCRARGTEELLEDRCGVIVPIGDVGSLSQAMIWMSTNPEEAAEMGRLGRRKVLERYDLPHSLAVTEALYRRILDKQ